MARPLRLEFSGALYHVTSRGNGRKPIYLEESDFETYLRLLGDVKPTWSGLDSCPLADFSYAYYVFIINRRGYG